MDKDDYTAKVASALKSHPLSKMPGFIRFDLQGDVEEGLAVTMKVRNEYVVRAGQAAGKEITLDIDRHPLTLPLAVAAAEPSLPRGHFRHTASRPLRLRG